MRQIKASEIKPGMKIKWFDLGIKCTCVVSSIEPSGNHMFQEIMAQGGGEATLDNNAPVTVLSEPPQPEEPKAFGAAVETPHWSDRDGCQKFIWDGYGWAAECGNTYTWDALTEFGTVKVTNPDPFAKPAPEVPDRIEKWPKDDTALRKHPWRDRDGDTWTWVKAQAEWECRDHRGVRQVASNRPFSRFAPFTRVTDA